MTDPTLPSSAINASGGGAVIDPLLPIEAMSLTVALEQMFRGDDLAPNTAMVCVLALARLTGRHDWTEDPK